MKRALFILVAFPSLVGAACPIYGPAYTAGTTDQEFRQVCHDIQFPVIETGIASTMTITGLIASTTTFNGVRYLWPSSQGAMQTHLQNDGAGTLSWALTGQVVQVIATKNIGAGSNTATSFTTLFNSDPIIPKSASSKTLVIFAGQMGENTAGQVGFFTFFKSVNGGAATNVVPAASGLTEVSSAAGGINAPGSIIWIDTTTVTQSTVYGVAGKVSGGTQTICDSSQQCDFYVIEIGQ